MSLRRLLVSQDHGEIYITIAEYDSTYERFLGLHHSANPSGKISDTSFLKMHCYGPWNTKSKNDLRHVCLILVALSFYLAK